LLDPVDHLAMAPPDQFGNFLLEQRKNMRNNVLALFNKQINQDAPPLFALPLKPLLDLLFDPLIEPCDEIHGGIRAFLDLVFIHFSAPKSPLAVLPLEMLVRLGRISNGILAAVAKMRHPELPASSINFPFNDAQTPKRDRISL